MRFIHFTWHFDNHIWPLKSGQLDTYSAISPSHPSANNPEKFLQRINKDHENSVAITHITLEINVARQDVDDWAKVLETGNFSRFFPRVQLVAPRVHSEAFGTVSMA